MKVRLLIAALAALSFASAASLADEGSKGQDHASKSADGIGVLNSIDVPGAKVNISHEPVPALEWPAMTMDLPTDHHLDLKGFKSGQKVQFTVAEGQNGVFRIVAMCPTDKDKVVKDLCPESDGHGHDHGDHEHGDHGHGHDHDGEGDHPHH